MKNVQPAVDVPFLPDAYRWQWLNETAILESLNLVPNPKDDAPERQAVRLVVKDLLAHPHKSFTLDAHLSADTCRLPLGALAGYYKFKPAAGPLFQGYFVDPRLVSNHIITQNMVEKKLHKVIKGKAQDPYQVPVRSASSWQAHAVASRPNKATPKQIEASKTKIRSFFVDKNAEFDPTSIAKDAKLRIFAVRALMEPDSDEDPASKGAFTDSVRAGLSAYLQDVRKKPRKEVVAFQKMFDDFRALVGYTRGAGLSAKG